MKCAKALSIVAFSGVKVAPAATFLEIVEHVIDGLLTALPRGGTHLCGVRVGLRNPRKASQGPSEVWITLCVPQARRGSKPSTIAGTHLGRIRTLVCADLEANLCNSPCFSIVNACNVAFMAPAREASDQHVR